MEKLRLDDLYYMVSHIYSEQNAHRPAAATFAHFVEVCGMLATHDRNKKREHFTIEDALCKALGWYFPLLAKFKVKSVEDLIFRKYPHVCPYCRLETHNDLVCKTTRGTKSTLDNGALRAIHGKQKNNRPGTLDEWQAMFQRIYPRILDKPVGRSTLGLLEELGELAEAIRVFDYHPKYFAGEAADVFSYLMGIANEYSLDLQLKEGRTFSLESCFIKMYPGLCPQCGCQVCLCPSVPESTVGRLAKELDLLENDDLFLLDPIALAKKAKNTNRIIFDRIGGFPALVKNFPFDRGDANKALVMLCLQVAQSIGDKDPLLTDALRSAAVRIGSSATYSGARQHTAVEQDILDALRDAWRKDEFGIKSQIPVTGDSLTSGLGRIVGKIRVLMVLTNADELTDPLLLGREARVARESVDHSRLRDMISIRQLPGATIDEVRKVLLEDDFEIVHFCGHGTKKGFLFDSTGSLPVQPTLDSMRAWFKTKKITCVIFNACYVLSKLNESLGPITVGMTSALGDLASVSFTKGFYEALGAGKSILEAIEEGKSCVALNGHGKSFPIKVLRGIQS